MFFVGGFALFFGIKQIRKHPRGRYYFDKMLLHIPVIGSLLRKIAVGRFTRTLGTLITSGVPILEGLTIYGEDLRQRRAGRGADEGAQSHRRRTHHRRPVARVRCVSEYGHQMIGVGEATGAMDSMLQKIADFYEEEVDAATKDMLAMLEPFIIGTWAS